MAGGLTRWDPLAEITQLRSRFDRLLDELGGQDHGAWMPAIDLVRHDDDLVVRVDLPGIKSRMVRVAPSSPTRRLAAVVGLAAPRPDFAWRRLQRRRADRSLPRGPRS
jgi:hypothetical protein